MYASYYLTQQEYADYIQSTSLLPEYSVKPQLLMRYGRLKEPLRVTLNDLLTDTEVTYADQETTLTTVVFINADGFSVNDFILLGDYLNETSEIVRITALVGTTATVVASRKHPTGTKISRLLYDQVEISNSPNLGVTKTVLTTVSLQSDNDTFYTPSVTSGFYYARYYNSFSANYSDYSDALPIYGFNKNMARAIIDNALMGINKDINDVLSDEYGFVELNNCLEEVQKASKRYSFYQVNRIPTKAEYGRFTYPIPSTINLENNQVLYVEYDNALIYKDNRSFDMIMPRRTITSEAVGIGAGVIKGINTQDFPRRVDFTPSNPVITVVGLTGTTQYTYTVEVNTSRGWSKQAGTQVVNGYSTTDYINYNKIVFDEQANATEYRLYRTEGGDGLGLLYQGPYIAQFLDTGKSVIAPIETVQAIGSIYISGISIPYIDNSNNIFTLQYACPVAAGLGSDITSENTIGNPTYFTIEDDNMIVYPAPDTEKNFYMTGYTTNTYMNQDQDTIPFTNTMVAVYYLQWKFLVKQNNGMETEESLAKKSQYEKQLYSLRTKDNNGVTQLKPMVKSWKY